MSGIKKRTAYKTPQNVVLTWFFFFLLAIRTGRHWLSSPTYERLIFMQLALIKVYIPPLSPKSPYHIYFTLPSSSQNTCTPHINSLIFHHSSLITAYPLYTASQSLICCGVTLVPITVSPCKLLGFS